MTFKNTWRAHSISAHRAQRAKEKPSLRRTVGLYIIGLATLFNVLKCFRVVCLGLGRALLGVAVRVHSPQPLVHTLVVVTHGAFVVGLPRFPLKTLREI